MTSRRVGRRLSTASVNELHGRQRHAFFEPERSEHFVVGYTRRFSRGLSLRVDVYNKVYSDLRPRFENLLDPIQLIPEAPRPDPHRRARGWREAWNSASPRGRARLVRVREPVVAEARETCRVIGSHAAGQRQTLAFGSSWTGANGT